VLPNLAWLQSKPGQEMRGMTRFFKIHYEKARQDAPGSICGAPVKGLHPDPGAQILR
jgi:hypothetical protein